MNSQQSLTSDVETTLRTLANSGAIDRYREFGCACCRRISHLVEDEVFSELIEFAEHRSKGGDVDLARLDALRGKSTVVYDRLYPGYGDPTDKVYALSAVGEVAFTDSSLTAAINASEFAANATAMNAACHADETTYDSVFKMAFDNERLVQARILSLLYPS